MISLIVIILISWLAPQFIYQTRPYTFYISGFAFALILLVSGASISLPNRISIYRWSFFFVLSGYLIGHYIPISYLQLVLFGFSFLALLVFLWFESVKKIRTALVLATVLVSALIFWRFATPITLFEEQESYEDKVLFSKETQYHQLVVTQWHDNKWFFIDGLKNLSSIDEYLYYEPMVHAVFKVADQSREVLVLGGENGCLLREVIKYKEVSSVDVVSYDSILSNLGMDHPYFTEMNQQAYANGNIHMINQDLLEYISQTRKKYDAIFIDLPDPRSIESNQYYTFEFYELIKKLMEKDGVMITQAGSPYFATEAFLSIGRTIEAAGFYTKPIHNQILTLGEWGWYICSLDQSSGEMGTKLTMQKEVGVDTKWFNNEAAQLIAAFGKPQSDTTHIGINSIENPLVYQYYLKGNWNLN